MLPDRAATDANQRLGWVPGRRSRRAGQVLVEFAMIALVLYLLLAAILTFGYLLFVAQGLQTAADLGARELSRTSLPAAYTFEEALADPRVRQSLFDEAYLVINLDTPSSGENLFVDLVPTWPLLNQQLATVMIVDRLDLNGDGNLERILRYPGALIRRTEPLSPPQIEGETQPYPDWVESGYAIRIPLINRDEFGAETIRWVPVVEEIWSPDSGGAQPFPLSSSSTSGVVALRINYPFQSAAMSSFRPNPEGPFEPNLATPNFADDSAFAVSNPDELPGDLIGGPLVAEDGTFAGVYGGQYGLGSQAVLGGVVRPYRRVISTQAIYRREIFE